MRRISLGFFTNPRKEQAVSGLKAALKHALGKGYTCALDDSILPLIDENLPSTRDMKPDFIIAFGGDGTILHAVALAADSKAPILGVNLGRIGFLSEVAPDDFTSSLDRLAAGDYSLDRRTLFACSVNGEAPRECLNEVLLYKHSFSGIIDISMEIDGMHAGSLRCDGMIISTSTGATGYSISAGGPVIAPGLDAAIITPICPHTLSARPIVAAPDSKMLFSLGERGYLVLDGDDLLEVMPGDTITVTRSERTVDFIRFGERNVFSLVRHKLA